MNEMLQDDQLDRQLREAAPYLDDDGFTARVVSKLPPAGRAPGKMRGIILVAVTALGSAIAYAISGGRFVDEAIVRLSSFPVWVLIVFAFGCGLVVGACAVIAAVRKTPEMRDLRRLQS